MPTGHAVNGFRGAAQAMRTAMVSAVFPERCRACDRWMAGAGPDASTPDRGEGSAAVRMRRLLSVDLCTECLMSVTAVVSPMCTRCGLPFIADVGDDHLCAGCMTSPAPLKRVRSAGVYASSFMALIHRYKYHRCLHLAKPFGHMLAGTIHGHWHPGEIDLMVPVPLFPRRMRERGFNQAWQMMRPFHGGPAARHVLVRTRHTAPQTGLTRRERKQNLAGAFAVRKPEIVAGRRVLVVDDVMTTGATLNACAVALLGAGASRVDAVTLARTIQETA